MPAHRRIFALVLILAILAVACGRVEPSSTPPSALVEPNPPLATQSPETSLPPSATRRPTAVLAPTSPSPESTSIVLPGTADSTASAAPSPSVTASSSQSELGIVAGWIDYPWDHTTGAAGINLFLENTGTEQITVVPLEPGVSTYTASVPPGIYHAYAWSPDYSQKGAYTACQPGASCTDHTLQPITVTVGTTVSGVDLVDWVAPEGSPIVLSGTLIDGTGADPLPDAVLVIREERIVAVGARAQVSTPDNAQIFDLPQATLLPGFINTHVHNTARTTYLKLWAQAGVTTIRDLGAPLGRLYFATRDRLRTDPQTARILAAGPLVTVQGGYPIAGNDFPSLVVLTPDDARQKIGSLIARGADVIKITIESGAGPILSPEMAAAIAETAHLHGVPVSAHVTRAADLERALDAGVDDIAHIVIDHVPDETIQRMVDMDVSWVPTLDAIGGMGTENLRRFVQAGGRVALGNDAGYLPGLEFGMPMQELRWMETAGMTPMQIIIAATGDAAEVCHRAGALGTLKVGKLADILVVEGDPLQDLGALENVQIVVHSGAVIRGQGMSK